MEEWKDYRVTKITIGECPDEVGRAIGLAFLCGLIFLFVAWLLFLPFLGNKCDINNDGLVNEKDYEILKELVEEE